VSAFDALWDASFPIQHMRLVDDHGDAAAIAAFDHIGRGWGGRWSSVRDYQHLSATGR
jgi:hypothetical protein